MISETSPAVTANDPTDDGPITSSFAADVVGAHVPTTLSPDGHEVLFVDRGEYYDAVEALKSAGFEVLADLTAVDYLRYPTRPLPGEVTPERFELVVMLLSMAHRRRARLRVQVPEGDPLMPSLWALYRAAEALEREVFDMFGIVFQGHPDLTRILMPEDWEGHPLRKDFGVGRVPVQFKEAPGPR